MIANEVEEKLHAGRPCFLNNHVRSPLFQDVFVGSGKWFRRDVGATE
jgi:hypothetical protein